MGLQKTTSICFIQKNEKISVPVITITSIQIIRKQDLYLFKLHLK